MKNIALFFCLFFASILNGQSILDRTVSLSIEGNTLKEAFTQLDKKANVRFFFDATSLTKYPLSIKTFSEQKVGDILSKLLEGTDLSFVNYQDFAIVIASRIKLESDLTAGYFTQKTALNTLAKDASMMSVGDADNVSQKEKVRVTGKVFDGNSKEKINGAVVVVTGSNENTSTDTSGTFLIEVPIGKITFEVIMAGFAPFYQQVLVYNEGEFNIAMYQKNIDLQEFVVKDAAKKNIRTAQTGVSELSIKQIKQLPSLLGEADVLRSLLTLPGVSNVGEGSSGFNVRGGNIDQNLILQDGAFVFNPSHVLGLFSSFNPDVVKKVTLYKGHIPAQFGGRLSSVLDIKLKDADFDKFKMSGGIGPLTGRLVAEIPIFKGHTSLLLGGRTSYSNWVLRQVDDIDLNKSSVSFYDANVKLTHRFNLKSNIALSAYRSNDDFQFSDQYGYGWTTQSATAVWNQIINSKNAFNLSIIAGENKNNFTFNDKLINTSLTNGLQYAKAKFNYTWSPLSNHNINIGAESTLYSAIPENSNQSNKKGEETLAFFIPKEKGQETGLYLNDEITISDKWSFSLGVRQSLYRSLGERWVYNYKQDGERKLSNLTDSTFYGSGQTIQSYQGFEPRASLNYSLDKNSSVKMSYNRMYQFIHLISNTTAATPVDIWQVSNKYIPPQYADNFSIGYYKNINDEAWETSLEFYYKDIKQLIEYKDFAQLTRNNYLETELIPARGRTFGAELYIKRNQGNLTGWISYAFARSFRQTTDTNFTASIINRGQWFPANFDKPHNFNLVLNWNFKKTQTLSINFTYGTGRPITAPASAFFTNDVVLLNYSDRNEYRIPDYHRMDISYTITRSNIRTKGFKGSLTFAIYNLYFRRNAFSVFFKRDIEKFSTAYRLSVLGTAIPSVTYNFNF
jgi:TonB dependent receptor/CarboxypepD_reg-like domain/TonB-dependent Receptor Plug Domain